MNSLADALQAHHDEITRHLYIGYAVWDDLTARVEREEAKPAGDCVDEQLWTFLVACGYAIAGEQGVAELTRILTGSDQESPANPKIWFEVSPVPPRKNEGNTRLDLALGTIAVRQGAEAGVTLDDAASPWICFCEMKWHADIDVKVAHDVHRNQLARVIENALCFQDAGRYAEKVYVTLVTPAAFRDAPLKSRLYQYKFEEYKADPASLIADLEACVLEKREEPGWSYPADLARRVTCLSLRWVTYDELFQGLPGSPIAEELANFWKQHADYQGLP